MHRHRNDFLNEHNLSCFLGYHFYKNWLCKLTWETLIFLIESMHAGREVKCMGKRYISVALCDCTEYNVCKIVVLQFPLHLILQVDRWSHFSYPQTLFEMICFRMRKMICMSVIYVVNLILLPPATQSPSDLTDVDSTPLGKYLPSSYQERIRTGG